MHKIYCLMFSGKSLSGTVSEALYQAAVYCVRKECNKRKVIHDDVEGLVQTDFETMIIGSVAGIIFNAEIDCINGSTKVTYIVSENDIDDDEEYAWVKMSNVKEDRCPFSSN